MSGTHGPGEHSSLGARNAPAPAQHRAATTSGASLPLQHLLRAKAPADRNTVTADEALGPPPLLLGAEEALGVKSGDGGRHIEGLSSGRLTQPSDNASWHFQKKKEAAPPLPK